MEAYTEPYGLLNKKTIDIAQALKSLQEELEAIDYYNQRCNTCTNEDLKRIMAHNRDEEMEHAIMGLEWLRRTMPGWDAVMRTYLFTTGDITALEDAATAGEAGPETATPAAATAPGGASLGIGSLKGNR